MAEQSKDETAPGGRGKRSRREVLARAAGALGVIAAMAALVATLGAGTLLAQENDAMSGPSSVLHPAVDNTSRTTDLVVTLDTNAVVAEAVMDLGAKSHGCEVTASAEVFRSTDAPGTYVFSIGRGSTASTTSSERRVQFVATGDLDVVWEDVATNQGYDNLTGIQTFYVLVRKKSQADADTTLTNETLSVVCANAQL